MKYPLMPRDPSPELCCSGRLKLFQPTGMSGALQMPPAGVSMNSSGLARSSVAGRIATLNGARFWVACGA